MKSFGALIMVVFLLVPLSGCSNGEQAKPSDNILESSGSVSSSPMQSGGGASETAAVEETWYPVRSWSWVDDATAVAIEYDGTISYVGLDNKVKSEAEIAPELLCEEFRLIYSDSHFFMLRRGNDDNTDTNAYQVNGEWRLFNGSVHNHDGTAVKVFPKLLTDYETNEVSIDGEKTGFAIDQTPNETFEHAVWLGDDCLALVGSRRLFFYEVAVDRLILVDDFSNEIPIGKEWAYHGIRNVVAYGEGCLYFVFDIMGQGNNEGHLYYGDANGGRQDILRGATFGTMFGNDGVAVTQTYTYDPVTGDYAKTGFSYLDENQNRGEIPPVPGWAFYHGAFKTETGGRIVLEGEPNPERVKTFYVFDYVDSKAGFLSTYSPKIENRYQYELITVRGERGSLEYLFSAMNSEAPDNPKSYCYSEETKVVTELQNYIPRMNDDLPVSSNTHYIDFFPDPYETTHIRVRKIA